MKVSRREGTALIVLLFFGAAYLFYNFLFSPMLNKISDAGLELQDRQSQLELYETTVARGDLDTLKADQQALVSELEEKTAPFLPHFDEAEIISFADAAAKSQNITFYAVSFGTEELFDTTPEEPAKEIPVYPLREMAAAFRAAQGASEPLQEDTSSAGSDAAQAGGVAPVAGRLYITIDIGNITYNQLIGFIKKVEAYDRAIYLENLSVASPVGEQAGLSVSMQYSLIQVDKLTDADKGLAEVTLASGAGRADPFAG